ncbi:hypothetical protein G7Z17_g8037 [Cylindrodendrum hubeiense]|uniref:MOSC domain-containing protein n=1 Tax=Cylindrodendrum hubeiense TaxID=595255 RepID=A0A9P5H9C3_9HYPO|nr:hypothetical protein G7Z17_g8037 [Cylindrodendrum hubeiense]
MGAFRPKVVVNGEAEWDEEFRAELCLNSNLNSKLALTKNCNRCTWLNVDNNTGRTAEGGRGRVLKNLMSGRQIDSGAKHSPVFGRHGFLIGSPDGKDEVSVGSSVEFIARMS